MTYPQETVTFGGFGKHPYILPGIGYGDDSLGGIRRTLGIGRADCRYPKFARPENFAFCQNYRIASHPGSWKGRRGNDEPIRYLDGINTRDIEMGDSLKVGLFHGGEFGGAAEWHCHNYRNAQEEPI
jgi:hypothetical protein